MARKPKYRRHVGRNRAFVEWNRRRYYLPGSYKSPESLKAYRAFLERNVYPFDTPAEHATSPAVILVGAIVTQYLVWAERHYPTGSRSEFSNMKAAAAHLSAEHGLLPAAEFGPKRLKAIQLRLAKAKQSRGYVNAVSARIKRIFKWAVSEELIEPSVFHGLQTVTGLRKDRSPALETRPREPVEWESVAAILPELSPAVHAMVLVQWFTGARSQSVCMARAGQFDTSVEPWTWKPKHKSEGTHDLTLFIGPQCRQVLLPFLQGRKPGEFLFRPVNVGGKRSRGYRSFYDSVSYLRAVARAQARVNLEREKAGLKPLAKWVPHQLRHTRATLVRSRYGLEAAQATLGHSRLDTTQIYAQRLRALAVQVANETG
jgi:integrase